MVMPLDKMEPRQRKGKSALNSDGNPGGVERHTRGESVDKTFTRAILFLVLSTMLMLGATLFTFTYPEFREPILTALRFSKKKEYAVILDAGSTGSRVLGFTFHRTWDGTLKLEDELWMQVKPGLSGYADDPSAATKGLLELVDAAKKSIPETSWSTTPITLKATAGLRLLSKSKSEAILNEARKVLESSGFRMEKNLIEIMNPMEEGLFGWFTVNLLLRQFENVQELSSTFASLDLGGGSTQITFAPGRSVSGVDGRKHFNHDVSVLGKNFEVYSHSYLGLGLLAAREFIINTENPIVNDEDDDSAARRVQLSCFTSNTPKNWTYHGKDYVLSSKPSSSIEECSRAVSQVISKEGVHLPDELKERRIAAFSYFFDLAKEHGDVLEEQFHVEITVVDFLNMARKACTPEGRGFNCHDLVFIYSLLSQGYGLPDDKHINLYKKIDGHEASWALGLAYNILTSKHQ